MIYEIPFDGPKTHDQLARIILLNCNGVDWSFSYETHILKIISETDIRNTCQFMAKKYGLGIFTELDDSQANNIF